MIPAHLSNISTAYQCNGKSTDDMSLS